MATFAQPLVAPKALARPLGSTTCVITAGPWFSAVTGQAFAATARDAVHDGALAVVLDLTTVRAVDAAGTTSLALLAEELEAEGCELALAATHPGVASWLQTTPVDAHLPLHESVPAALGDLLRRPL